MSDRDGKNGDSRRDQSGTVIRGPFDRRDEIPPPSPTPNEAEQFRRQSKRGAGMRGWVSPQTVIGSLIVAGIIAMVGFYADTSAGMQTVEENQQRSKRNSEQIQVIKQDQSAAKQWRGDQERRTKRILRKLDELSD